MNKNSAELKDDMIFEKKIYIIRIYGKATKYYKSSSSPWSGLGVLLQTAEHGGMGSNNQEC